MKKCIVLLLCFVLTVSLLCACRGKAPSETAGPTGSSNATNATPMATLPTTGTTPSQSGSTDATGSARDNQSRSPISAN